MSRLFIFLSIISLLNSCYAIKAVRYRKFNLNDLEKLDGADLPQSAQPYRFIYDTANRHQLATYLDSNLKNSLTYSFMVIRNDTVLYERYFGEVTESSKLPSFSMAKSFVSTLLGIALHEGYIKSLQEPVTYYLPGLAKNDPRFKQVTIQHVLDMRSGVKSSEGYGSPFSDVIKMGFVSNVNKHPSKLKLKQLPGEFDYRSVNTQLLAQIIEKATGKKLQDYAMEKLWQPLGMEFHATWNKDKKDNLRAFCCINAATRDYAKFGLLFLNKGFWQGRQVVPEEWITRSVDPDTLLAYGGYKNQWWTASERQIFDDSIQAAKFTAGKKNAWLTTYPVLDQSNKTYVVRYPSGAYHAQGILGQFIYVNPQKNLVIVRLGQNWSHPSYYAQSFIYDLGNRL
jgi:CubicO group peptidase (beta-lactamase class C family)